MCALLNNQCNSEVEILVCYIKYILVCTYITIVYNKTHACIPVMFPLVTIFWNIIFKIQLLSSCVKQTLRYI